MEDGRYLLATEKLNTIRSQYPYSFFATHAELLQADILFKQESFVEASAAYSIFKDLHPRNEKIDYVIYKLAESYYNQLPSTFDRDLTPANEAIKYYNELLNRYPNSEYVKGSQDKIATCKDLLMKKEKYIADFYFKTEVYDSAKYRYLTILKEFNDPEIKDHAMLRILKSSLNLKEYRDCANYYDVYSNSISEKNAKNLKSIYNECSQLGNL